jgi:hypothetical protein
MAKPLGKLMGNFGAVVDCTTTGATVGAVVAVNTVVPVVIDAAAVLAMDGCGVVVVWAAAAGVQAASRKMIITAKIGLIFMAESFHKSTPPWKKQKTLPHYKEPQ